MSAGQSREARARARVALSKFGNRETTYYRGLLLQIQGTGLVPAGVVALEEARARHHWTDANGRECSLTPYATYQWELRIRAQPEVRKQVRTERDLDHREQQARWARDNEVRRLEAELEDVPMDAASAQRTIAQRVRLALVILDHVLDGGSVPFAPGCRAELVGVELDEETRGEIQRLAHQIQCTAETATVYFDPAPVRNKRARLADLNLQNARGDRRFSAMLQEVSL